MPGRKQVLFNSILCKGEGAIKIYKLKGNDYKLVIGSAREIKNLYRNLTEREIGWSVFSEPKFNMDRCYGITMKYKSR